MRFPYRTTLALVSTLAIHTFGCGDSTSSGGGNPGGSGQGGEPTNGGGGSTSTAGGDTGGTTTGGGGSGTGGVPTTGGGGAGEGGTGGSAGTDHLVISEIAVQPGPSEFIEIYNPTGQAVSLDDYYLSDNSAYFGIAAGDPWNPVTNNPGTDFLGQFPAGETIDPGGVKVIATSVEFETAWGLCPDYILSSTETDLVCANGTATAMVAPANGGIGDKPGTLLSNDREMVILFHWTGDTNDPVEDVDYVTWGTQFEDATRVDKTGIGPYVADTARANQDPAPAPMVGETTERCTLETGETLTGGNGITGHDETSEPLGTNFVIQAAPTPGAKNTCLP